MSEIILVRHGQANSKATSEAEYDRLSDLGWQQARWLGETLRAQGAHFDHVVSGDMRRHLETAEGLGVAPQVDARWNELNYFGLSEALHLHKGVAHPSAGEGFFAHAQVLFDHWTRDDLPDAPEPWTGFESRIFAALDDSVARGGRTLVVTSAGVVGALLRRVLSLNTEAHVKLITQTVNTSVHRLVVVQGHTFMAEFNTTPHLDDPERQPFRTFF